MTTPNDNKPPGDWGWGIWFLFLVLMMWAIIWAMVALTNLITGGMSGG